MSAPKTSPAKMLKVNVQLVLIIKHGTKPRKLASARDSIKLIRLENASFVETLISGI